MLLSVNCNIYLASLIIFLKMFISSMKNRIKKITFKSAMMFGGSHGSTPKGRLMVKDKIIWLNVMNSLGELQRVPWFPGETMMLSLKKSRVPGVIAEWGGGDSEMSPAEVPIDFYSFGAMWNQCQVILPKESVTKVPMNFTEKRQLDFASGELAENTRLSCCIKMAPWMNEMYVRVGPNNQSSQHIEEPPNYSPG